MRSSTRRFAAILTFTLAALLLPGSVQLSRAATTKPLIVRFSSLAPANSSFGKVLKAWGRQIKKETEGRVELRVYSGGSQGDERDFIRKMRAGQVDGAGVSTTGLGMLIRPMLVLTAPGLIREYQQFYNVRDKLQSRFEKMFDEAGFVLIVSGLGGKNRIMSTQAFAKPDDLKSARPWAWKDDPVFDAFLKTIGANPVRLGVPEVYPALQTRMVDTVPVSAIAAVAFQWYTRLNYVANDNFNIILGGSIIKKEKFQQMSTGDQEIFVETGRRAGKALDALVIRDDDRAYDSLIKRGLKEADVKAHAAAWEAASKKTREELAGRVYSKSLLQAVEAALNGK